MSAARRRSPLLQSRLSRSAALARLALRIGGRYLARSPRLIFASVERRGELRHELALRTADDVAEELGSMKGALMKLGQMASYIDEDMPPTFRAAMARLQHNAPPMSPALASSVIADELGDVPERIFARWDPLPFAAASIGQVHRAITLDGRAVAVKVQYPGIAPTITSDVRNVALLRRVAAAAFPGLDTRSLIDELGERLREEVDYRLEAENQELFARYYEGHPVIHVPHVVGELSTARVLTSELVVGARFDDVLHWKPRGRDDKSLCLPQPVPPARVQRRSAPGQLPFSRAGPGELSRLRAHQAIQRRRSRPVGRRGSFSGHRKRWRRLSRIHRACRLPASGRAGAHRCRGRPFRAFLRDCAT